LDRYGIVLRSFWDIADRLRVGGLERVLSVYGQEADVWAVHPIWAVMLAEDKGASSLTQTQKTLLAAIYREIGGEDAMLAGVNLLQHAMSSHGLDRGLETRMKVQVLFLSWR
jgi:hypothetical protein